MARLCGELFLLFLSAVVLLPTSSADREEQQLQGKMETQDGSTCVWFELRKGGSRGNVFVTACHCKDAQGHRHSYSCEFDGPMEECEEYQHSPKEFYDTVATLLQKDYGNPCKAASISVTRCPNVTLQKSKSSDPEAPCVPGKDEL